MSKKGNRITIRKNSIFKNGNLFFKTDRELTLKEFLKTSWKHLGVKYPKFYKMDEISKLAMLATEVLLMDEPHKNYDPEMVGIVLSNAHSTLVTDINHWNTVNSDSAFFPSPAVFVYTLPNIMIGEICIKHKFKGENAFFINKEYDEAVILQHIDMLMAQNKINAAVGGWVDQYKEDYLAEIFWVTGN